jgi:pimeloyl-ACP methyl ester carboxylesterase
LPDNSQPETGRFEIPHPGSSKQSYEIPAGERDRGLLAKGWPRRASRSLTGKWKIDKGHLLRQIAVYGERDVESKEHANENRTELQQPHNLWEALLRFPNSPLIGTHRPRKRPFQFVSEDGWPNLHTMRVIGKGDEPGGQIKHVYLLHNGLNETTDLLFHYRLAAWILESRAENDAVCILRPLPGHLTRFPFQSPYTEQPLDGYLRDPGDLFRQFLRYMQETQWLLSALMPRPHYAVAAGTRLLAEAAQLDRGKGRGAHGVLARAIAEDWQEVVKANVKAEELYKGLAQAQGEPDEHPSTQSKQDVSEEKINDMVAELRKLLGWKGKSDADERRAAPKQAAPEPPSVHVVGYSMGGFMAQAAFFAWPFAISSCTNLFAGGALRDLAPTAFAHPEEWQAVLHGLRYELDRAFREGYLKSHETESTDGSESKVERVAGIDADDFSYFTRIFYEVYLQYYRGGYASRVSEFSRRLLFVVGGDDPIVRTKNVLDAGPPEGMTLIQIADVSHFPGGRGHAAPDGGKVENEQRVYWLPEVGRVIANFSERSSVLLHKQLTECWDVTADRDLTSTDLTGEGKSTYTGSQSPDKDPNVREGAAFTHELRKLVDVALTRSGHGDLADEDRQVNECWCAGDEQADDCDEQADAGDEQADDGDEQADDGDEQADEDGRGWLLVSRNEIPPVFLGPRAYRFYGQAVHHSEDQIAQYVRWLRARAWQLRTNHERVSLLVPQLGEVWFQRRGDRQTFFSKSETPNAARLPSKHDLETMWGEFESQWMKTGAVRVFAGREYKPTDLAGIGPVVANGNKLSLTVLPDVWIGLSASVTKQMRKDQFLDTRDGNEEAVIAWTSELAEDKSEEHKEQLAKWLADEELMAMRISAAEINPRFRGRRLEKEREVKKALVHWALSYRASKEPNVASTASDGV